LVAKSLKLERNPLGVHLAKSLKLERNPLGVHLDS